MIRYSIHNANNFVYDTRYDMQFDYHVENIHLVSLLFDKIEFHSTKMNQKQYSIFAILHDQKSKLTAHINLLTTNIPMIHKTQPHLEVR